MSTYASTSPEMSSGSEQPKQAAEQRISLSTWLAANYSQGDAPTRNTVRRWVREKRIQPAPQKQGRSYYFSPSARYVELEAAPQ